MSKILIVDDDPHIRELASVFLRQAGFDMIEACDGKEALAKLDSVKVDLFVIDIMMPVMDGCEFRAEQLRDPRLCHIPIVVITAHANIREMEAELKTSGALRKPVSLPVLLAVARLHCGEPNRTV